MPFYNPLTGHVAHNQIAFYISPVGEYKQGSSHVDGVSDGAQWLNVCAHSTSQATCVLSKHAKPEISTMSFRRQGYLQRSSFLQFGSPCGC